MLDFIFDNDLLILSIYYTRNFFKILHCDEKIHPGADDELRDFSYKAVLKECLKNLY